MMTLVLPISFGLLTLAVFLSLVRLVRGPNVLDRILAFDLIATSVVGMIALLSVKWQTAVYLELILLYSLLGFLSAITFVLYLHKTLPVRGTPPDPPSAASPGSPAA